MTSLALVPTFGAPVVVPASGWQATLDVVERLGAVHESLLAGLRRAPGVHVTEPQAAQIAWACQEASREPELSVPDRTGLERLATFCRSSGGFAVLDASAAPPAPRIGPTPVPAWQRRLRRVLGPFAVVVIAAVQWLAKLKVLLLLLPKLKLFSTAFTALISIGFYALFWGWRFAVLFVALLFLHELGHVIACRQEGIPATAPMFIPFMGAVIGLRGAPRNAWVEAKIGLAGPLLGTAAALALLEVGNAANSNLVRAAAYTGLILNLFNLAPVTPLDGGRAAAALHPYVWFLGIFGLALLFFIFPNAILILILVIAAMDVFRRIREYRKRGPQNEAYYKIRPWQRLVVAAVYFGLAALLVVSIHSAVVPRPH